MHRRLASLLSLVTVAVCLHASSQQTADGSVVKLRQHLDRLRQVVETCSRDEKACKPEAASDDEHIALPTGQVVNLRHDWVRQYLEQMGEAKERASASQQTGAVLARLAEEARGTEQAAPPFRLPGSAEAKRDKVLKRAEFAEVSDYSLRDYLLGKVGAFLDRIFASLAGFGRQAPWIIPTIEVLAGLTVLAVLLLWIQRVLARHALRPLRADLREPGEGGQHTSRDWYAMARGFSEQGKWRDAIYCLYWASIAHLESRRNWRPDAARTPREYVRLLDGSSSAGAALRKLTLSFERVWYGMQGASPAEYDRALSLYGSLADADRSPEEQA